MKNLSQLFVGLITALTSSLIILGAASLSLLEGGLNTLPSATLPPASTPFPGETIQVTATTYSKTLQPTACPIPPGWTVYTVMVGDTLESLAEMSGATAEEIYQKNCLDSSSLVPGSTVHLPLPPPTATLPPPPTVAPSLTPTITTTAIQCGPPPGWVYYTVRSGDTLYRISVAYGVSVQQLMFANCLASDKIYAGQHIFVPNVTPRWPTSTRTPVIVATPTPEPTNTATVPPTPVIPTPDLTQTADAILTQIAATQTAEAILTQIAATQTAEAILTQIAATLTAAATNNPQP